MQGKGRFFQNSAVIFGRKFCATVPELSQSVLPFDGAEDLMTILRVPSSQLLITGWVTGLCTDIDISPAGRDELLKGAPPIDRRSPLLRTLSPLLMELSLEAVDDDVVDSLSEGEVAADPAELLVESSLGWWRC